MNDEKTPDPLKRSRSGIRTLRFWDTEGSASALADNSVQCRAWKRWSRPGAYKAVQGRGRRPRDRSYRGIVSGLAFAPAPALNPV